MSETALSRERPRIKWSQFRELNVLVALFLLCLFFYWRRPETFIKPANLAVIMRFIATFGMLAIGEVLVIITGGIDLSVGSMTALTGVITAWLMLKGVGALIPPMGMVPAILVALLLGKTAQADERGIALTVTEDTQLPSDIPLTGQEIVTVLGNLIDNALDACDRDEPWVEVTVNQDGEALTIRVADSGPGMDPRTFERAMRRGYSTKSDAAGHGLGLALIAQVVNRHHGTIAAEVTYGSVVTVTVPR